MRDKPLRLLIVGSGDPDRVKALKARAKKLGIDFAVAVRRARPTTSSPGSHAARAFALVSHWEGSSTALLEAMAVDAPVVASRQAGDARHVLDEGRFGALVDADNPASIAKGLLDQLSATPLRSGDRVEQYRLSRTHERYLELLRPL